MWETQRIVFSENREGKDMYFSGIFRNSVIHLESDSSDGCCVWSSELRLLDMPKTTPLVRHGRVEFSGVDHCLCCCSELSWRHSLDHPSRKRWARHVSPIVLSVLELGLLIVTIVFNFALCQCSVICHNASSWVDLDDVYIYIRIYIYIIQAVYWTKYWQWPNCNQMFVSLQFCWMQFGGNFMSMVPLLTRYIVFMSTAICKDWLKYLGLGT